MYVVYLLRYLNMYNLFTLEEGGWSGTLPTIVP